jgi:hypothetical protein
MFEIITIKDYKVEFEVKKVLHEQFDIYKILQMEIRNTKIE